jgi:LPXTG-site transpeptidase (sortase) family protein
VTFAGQVINYDYLLTNTTNITLTGITLSDNNTDSTPNCPQTSLFVGYSMTCTASHTVTQAELDTGGNLTNTALASSVEGGQTSSQLGIPIWQNPSLDLSKNVAEANYSAVGDVLHYSLATTNTGNVTLSNVSIADPLLGFLACTPTQPTSLAPVATLSCTGSHTITQADLDAGQFNNTANASGSFGGSPVNATPAGQSVPAVQNPLIGVAKRVVSVIGVSTGIYDVMYEIRVHNYGNVTLNAVQITDDLTSTFPPPNTFQVLSIIGSGLVVDNSFNGIANVNLLASGNSLASDAGGTINIVARIIPTSSGPFSNTALGFGTSPLDTTVTDLSQDGSNPDPDGDGNPLNNNDPTLFNLGPQLFDPPYGIKSVDTSGAPVLTWTLVWINTSNIVAVNAVVHDPISINTTFSATLVDSGYPVPSGAPFGSTSFGVACTTTSLITVTTLCYFEGPTIANPRGQIIWAGTLGPDPGITDPVAAENAIHISFNVSAAPNVTNGQNVSTVDADLNGNGNTTDPGEQQVALATASWSITPPTLPRTGFTLGQVSILPEQPKELAYRDLGDLWLEIPRLGVNMNIVGVPQTKGEWDVSWLGSNAGWLQGSAYPTWAGNSVLTGHVWNADNTAGPFRYITTLCYGDKVIIHAGGAQYVYEVRSVMQVGPGNINALMKHEEMPWVTLVTCRGYDTTTGTYHYLVLVRAVLVEVK